MTYESIKNTCHEITYTTVYPFEYIIIVLLRVQICEYEFGILFTVLVASICAILSITLRRIMTHENAIQIILEAALCTPLNNKMPSYYSLSQKYQCSRVVFQKAVKDLETLDILLLNSSNAGNVLANLNYNKILSTYYSRLFISCPKDSLLSADNPLTLEVLNVLNNINSTPYFSYEDASDHVITMLEHNIINFAIVTNDYYRSIANNNFEIFAKLPIKTPATTTINSPITYNFEEVSELRASDNSNNISEYNLICTKPTYNLFNNLT